MRYATGAEDRRARANAKDYRVEPGQSRYGDGKRYFVALAGAEIVLTETGAVHIANAIMDAVETGRTTIRRTGKLQPIEQDNL